MGISGRISGYFLRHSITPLLALVALLMGIFATMITPREEEPQIEVTMANVMVPFPGASARDVESLVAKPAEQVLSRMAGVDHVFSVSRPGMAVITVQFKVGVAEQVALVRLYDTVHSHQDWLSPELGVGTPIVKPKGIDDVPIVALTLWSRSEGASSFDLQQVARAAESEFKRIEGVREVNTIGGPGRAIRVLMDADRMAAHGVTALDLRNTLQLGNASRSAGSLVESGREVLVQAGVYLESAADVRHLVVGTAGGRPVFLADVADVVDGPDQPTRHVWHGLGKASGGNGQTDYPAVTLAMSKKPGVNAADVAAAVIARAESLKGAIIPAAVEVSVTRNYGATATEKAQKLIGKLAFATAFVVLLVLFALGKREAVIVGTAVTLTLAATLFASWAYGFTLNRVSLFALIFSIGILVDDAIVVVENIHRTHHLHPERTLAELIPGAVDEVGGPTILATFTVIAALLPMAFVSGLMGPYMSPIPINSSMGMFISLAVAFIVTPWLALKLLPAKVAGHGAMGEGGDHGGNTGDDRMTRRLDTFFRRIMRPLLDTQRGRRNRSILWIVVLIAILASVSLGAFKLVVLKMLPLDNKSEMQVVLDMPVGTPVDQTARVLREMAEYLASVPEVRDYEGYAGSASPINFNGLVRQYYLRSSPEMGDLQINLVDKHHRDRSSHQVAGAVRETVAAIARRHGGNAKVVEVPPGPPVLSPIVAEVYGPDYDSQISLAKRLRAIFESTPDIVGVDDSISASAEKKILKISPAKAASLGVNQRDIVDVVAMGLAGESVTPLHDGVSQYEAPIRVVLPEEKQSTIDQLLKLRVRATSGPQAGGLVPLSEVVEVNTTQREQVIYHKDLLPVVYVTGDMGGKLDSPLYGMFAIRSQVPAEVDQYFIHAPRDPYATYAIKWDGEWQITYETFRDMGIAYAVGLVLIYLLVVAQFGSYLAPLVIMAPIPLTIIGVMPGHALLGAQFTATSMIGMISLAGIIVRNSILLTDFINLQRAAGVAFDEAVIRAAVVRAKPIALTALAAMLGALFILDDPIFNGLAISLIFGILVATVLTLVVIPVLYYAAFRNRPQLSGESA